MIFLILPSVYLMTGGVNSASLCYSQRLNMHNTPAAASPKPFDLTSTAFLIVAFLTGIDGALQTPTLSLFLTNEVHVRPAMVGFFFTGSAVIGILVSQFLYIQFCYSILDSFPYVFRFHTSRVVITAKEEVSWVLDGEYGGTLKETVVENIHGAIALRCGEKIKKC